MKKKNYIEIFWNIIKTFLLITGIPLFVAELMEKYFSYNFFLVFIITLFIIWVTTIELRLRDIKKNVDKKKNGRKK